MSYLTRISNGKWNKTISRSVKVTWPNKKE